MESSYRVIRGQDGSMGDGSAPSLISGIHLSSSYVMHMLLLLCKGVVCILQVADYVDLRFEMLDPTSTRVSPNFRGLQQAFNDAVKGAQG